MLAFLDRRHSALHDDKIVTSDREELGECTLAEP